MKTYNNYFVFQNTDGSLLITSDGINSIPNAGKFINDNGGIEAILSACTEVDDLADNGKYNGLIVTYSGFTYGYVVTNRCYAGMAHNLEEAIQIIEGFKTYMNSNNSNLKVNDYTREKLAKYFDMAASGDFKFEPLKTTGCGNWEINISRAKADTVRDHFLILHLEADKLRKERIEKAKQEEQKKLAEMHEERKGWYAVSLTFQCYEYNSRLGMVAKEKTFTGQCIANSQMNAYDKACEEVRNNYPALEVFDWGCPTNDNTFYATFLGMKVDGGYSVEAWEEFMKNN